MFLFVNVHHKDCLCMCDEVQQFPSALGGGEYSLLQTAFVHWAQCVPTDF